MGLMLLEHHTEEVELVTLPSLDHLFLDDPDKLGAEYRQRIKDLGSKVVNEYVVWLDEGSGSIVDQLIITPSGVMIGDRGFPRGSGISGKIVPLSKERLKMFQVPLLGSGLKLYAYGDPADDINRKYQVKRPGETPDPVHEERELLGLVDISTGEVTRI